MHKPSHAATILGTAAALFIAYQACESSQLSAFGYDEGTQTLGIKFHNSAGTGSTYHYFDVPQEIFDGLTEAPSKGTYFGSFIRGKFRYEKQPEVPGGVAFGLPQAQEPKYTTSTATGRLVNRASGKPIPDDEPVFVLRAKDIWARGAIQAYLELLGDADHSASVRERLDAFLAYADTHAKCMQAPDTAKA